MTTTANKKIEMYARIKKHGEDIKKIFSLPASLPDAQDGAREAPADGPDALSVTALQLAAQAKVSSKEVSLSCK